MRRSGRRGQGIPIRGLLPLILALAAWQIFGSDESAYFPRPGAWVHAVVDLFHKSGLLGAVGTTALSFLIGLAISAVIGSAIGILVGSVPKADGALGPLLEFLRVMPAAVLVPFATLVFGYNMQMKLTVVVLASIWPILLAVRMGRRRMSGTILDIGPTMGLSHALTIRKIILPGLLPSLLTGLSIAAPLCLIVTLLVEIIARVPGIGSLIGTAQDNFASAQVYGLLVIAGIISIIVNQVVRRVETGFSRRIGTLVER